VGSVSRFLLEIGIVVVIPFTARPPANDLHQGAVVRHAGFLIASFQHPMPQYLRMTFLRGGSFQTGNKAYP
jgi:hypothetical protein